MKPYPAYKESGYDWTSGIPEHWKMVQLKFAAPRKTDQTENVKEFGFQIALENIESKTGKLISNGSFEGLGNIFRKGDVLFNKLRPYLCKVVIAPDDGVAVSELLVLRPREDIDKSYLFYRLLESKFILVVDGSTYGAKMPRANWDFIGNLKIPVPPLPEQQAITEFLDCKTAQIDTLIEKKQRQIDLLQEQRTAFINHAVTKGLNTNVPMKDSGVEWLGEIPSHWEVHSLKRLAELKSGDGITSEEIQETGDYAVYGGNGLRGYSYKYTHEGDFVLIGRQGALCGNINYALGKFWASEHAVVATPKKEYKTIWFGELLRAMNLNQYSMAAAQPGLSVERISNIQIPVPPIEEQEKIENFLLEKFKKFDQLMSLLSQQIELSREYRTALISEAVTGKIDVR